MRRILAMGTALALAGCSIGADMAAASSEAEKFHKMLDAGQCPDAYRSAARDLTSTITQEGWADVCQAISTRLGRIKSTKAVGWHDRIVNADHFMELQYDTVFERGSGKEEFVYRMVGGKASLAGYHVKSDALLAN